MPIFVDNSPLAVEGLTGESTVGQFVEGAKRRLAGTGRAIVSIRRDAVDIHGEDLERLLAAPPDEGRIDLVSGRPDDVVRDALEQARRVLSGTFVELKTSSEALGRGEIGGAMKALLACLSAWVQVQRCVEQSAEFLAFDLERLRVDGQSGHSALKQLAGSLSALKDALAGRDHVLLGDMLKYELDDAMQRWDRLLDSFIEQLAVGRGE